MLRLKANKEDSPFVEVFFLPKIEIFLEIVILIYALLRGAVDFFF